MAPKVFLPEDQETKRYDCGGYLLLPAFVDSHTHPDKTMALGMQGRVSVSHAFCLNTPKKVLIEKLGKAGIHIVTSAASDITPRQDFCCRQGLMYAQAMTMSRTSGAPMERGICWKEPVLCVCAIIIEPRMIFILPLIYAQ
jgi:hypothetical protein